MEPCEICGKTEGVQAFGIDYTPLCPKHYAEAERNVEAVEWRERWRRRIDGELAPDPRKA